MAKYLTAARIKTAIEALADTRGKAALMDFLIVKRTLAIKNAESVAITQTEASYIKATSEFAGVWNKEKIEIKAEKEIFNVYASLEKKQGYRSGKYISNGTGTTIGGNAWQTVISLTDTKPRAASFKLGYEAHLANLFLKDPQKNDKPSLPESAVWRYRRTDVEPIIAGQADPAMRLKAIRDYFVSEFKLNGDEIDALFLDDGESIEDADLSEEIADPKDYLPGLGAPVLSTASGENSDQCSFDLVTALSAKPFVILTGTSGTGKSRSTLKLAEQLQELYGAAAKDQIFQLVSIGPDWTSPKKLLGYRTPFGRQRVGKDPPAKYALGLDAVFGIEATAALEIQEDVVFKHCRDKLGDMHARLISRNYVSFVK